MQMRSSVSLFPSRNLPRAPLSASSFLAFHTLRVGASANGTPCYGLRMGASLLLCLLPVVALADAKANFGNQATVTAHAGAGGKTWLEFRSKEGPSGGLHVMRDDSVSANAAPYRLEVVGNLGNSVVVLIDSYHSVPGGLSYCQSGEESFLRVLSFANKKPVETFRLKLESCRNTITLDSPGVEWLAQSYSIRINWLNGPTHQGRAESRVIRIGVNGKPIPDNPATPLPGKP